MRVRLLVWMPVIVLAWGGGLGAQRGQAPPGVPPGGEGRPESESPGPARRRRTCLRSGTPSARPTTSRAGLGPNAFNDWRYLADGSPNPDFVLNKPESKGAEVLVAGHNFGCGSSREHAVWALAGAGFRAVVISMRCRKGMGDLIHTAPEAWCALATAGKANGDPSLLPATAVSEASRTVRPSSSIRIEPVLRTSPARGCVDQIESISPGPVCSAITQRPAARRRHA